jgi:hypothetical protein
MAKGTAEKVGTEISNELAEMAAREAAKESLESGAGLGEATGAAADAYVNSKEQTQGLGSSGSDDEGFFFKEWIIVNNKTNEKHMVYAKNCKDVVGGLIFSYEKAFELSKKERKQLEDIDNLDEAVQFLNTCE